VDAETVRPDRPLGERDGDSHGDFVAWAMGSREAARQLVIVPIAAGVLAALVATALAFGAGIPVFMDPIGWDLLRGYRCFVLPKQLVFFCMIAAPIASALILLTRPRLRQPKDADPPPPPIASVDQTVKVIGIVAFAVMVLVFHLFGTGWVLACRLESVIGIVSRYLLGAVVVVFAPTVSIAAMALAYQFRDRIKFGWAPDEARAAMRPIGLMIAIIALVTLDYAIVVHSHGVAHSPLVTTLIWLSGAFLLTQGSFAVARIAGWLSAVLIVTTVGDVLSAPLQTPLGLLLAKFRAAPLGNALTVILVFVWFGFALWIYQAVRAKPILDARAASGRTRSPPWTGFLFGALFFGFELGSYLMMDAKYGEAARNLARQTYGEQYAYQIKSYGYAGYTDHVFVDLEGYNDHELIKVQVNWKE
jgi:hypothetical protein